MKWQYGLCLFLMLFIATWGWSQEQDFDQPVPGGTNVLGADEPPPPPPPVEEEEEDLTPQPPAEPPEDDDDDDDDEPVQVFPAADVILLMDVSGSMEALLRGEENISKLNAAKQALVQLATDMKPDIRFQLWTFSSKLKKQPNSPEVEPPPRDVIFESIGSRDSPVRQHLIRVIREVEPPGDEALVTNLYEAIYRTINYFLSKAYKPAGGSRSSSQVIVVLSDGKDDGLSPVGLGTIRSAKRQYPNIDIRTIGYGIQPEDRHAQILCQIATENRCALANDAKKLEEVLKAFVGQ